MPARARLDRTLPCELERICLKALHKRASERYQTALALAEDLRHYEMLCCGRRLGPRGGQPPGADRPAGPAIIRGG